LGGGVGDKGVAYYISEIAPMVEKLTATYIHKVPGPDLTGFISKDHRILCQVKTSFATIRFVRMTLEGVECLTGLAIH
jgi:hypothetical protein